MKRAQPSSTPTSPRSAVSGRIALRQPTSTLRTSPALSQKGEFVMRAFRLALLLILIASTVTWAAKGPGPISVTSYISETDANGAPLSIQSDGLLGPVNHTVGEYDNGQQGISSVLEAGAVVNLPPGDWQLDTQNSTTRKLRFMLGSNAVPFGQPGYTVTPTPPFFGLQTLPGKLETKCIDPNS